MQKIVLFWQKVLFFLPVVIFLACRQLWMPFAVGLMNPVQAIIWLANPAAHNRPGENYNPFRDFSPSDFAPVAADTVYSEEKINSNYNVVKEYFSNTESDIVLKKEDCYVKNMTKLPASEVKDIMLADVEFTVEKNSPLPQILIMHTHATESYLPAADTPYDRNYAFRSTDCSLNMVAVGRVMADKLNSMGYNTLQDVTLHDYPSYNGSYDRSKDTVQQYLDKYPSIKIVLDIHRDAVERSGAIISPVVNLNGKEYAQIMIISGRDNGYMNMPHYRQNLKFASMVQNQVEKDWPGLARAVLFDYRNYNQQLTTGSILVEVGSHGSGLRQAKRSAEAFAYSLATALDNIAQ